MKILLISDSHYSGRYIAKAFNAEKPDVIIFLGDGLSGFLEFRDYELPATVDTYVVLGNCDYEYEGEFLTSQVVSLSGVRFFICHGHTLGVRRGIGDLCNNACLNDCAYALYGHTHVKNVAESFGVTAVNPGALEKGEYAVIEVKGGKAEICQKLLPSLK